MRHWFRSIDWPALCYTAVVCVFLFSVVGALSRIKEDKNHSANSRDEQEGVYEGRDSFVGVMLGFVNGDRDDINAASTLVIAIFTVALVFVGYIQARRLRETVEATNKAVAIAKVELETTQRAFVYIDGFNTEITTGMVAGFGNAPELYRDRMDLYLTRFAAAPRWKNSGTTPVRSMTIRVHWGHFPPLPMPPEYNYPHPAVSFVLGPNAIEAGDVVEIPSARALIDYGAFRRGPPSEILIWGRADYEDVFAGCHFVQWCYKLRFNAHDGERLRASFIQWGDYNRTDDDTRA